MRRVTVEGGYDGIKIGSGSQSIGLTVEDFRATNPSHLGMFLANVTNGVFRNLDLQTTGYPLYLERGNHNLSFYNINLVSLGNWTVHAYNWETQSEPSDGILIDGATISSAEGTFVLSGGWANITVRNATIHQSSSAWPVFRMYGGVRDVLIENCEVWGGSALLDVSHPESPPQNVVLRNVTYHGTKLPSYPWLTLENVVLVP